MVRVGTFSDESSSFIIIPLYHNLSDFYSIMKPLYFNFFNDFMVNIIHAFVFLP